MSVKPFVMRYKSRGSLMPIYLRVREEQGRPVRQNSGQSGKLPSPNGVEPCNQCINCVDVNEGRSLDVLEIDAASNRGIEEIRELKEKSVLCPAKVNIKFTL